MDESPTVERAYRMRVYPTCRQRVLLGRLFGAARYVWNGSLARRTEAYRCDGSRLNWVALSRELTALRRAEGTEWLAELRLLASGSPATGKRSGSHARGVACAAEGEQQATVVYLQCHPTMNREPARRSARAEIAQALSGARGAIRAGL